MRALTVQRSFPPPSRSTPSGRHLAWGSADLRKNLDFVS